MARKTRHNRIVTKEKMEEVLGENKELLDDFLEYCRAVNRSPATIYQYRNLLQIFFVWNFEDNENKSYFVITKRDFMTFFGYLTGVLGASPNRVASFRSALSSIGNYVELVLDEEYPHFRNNIKGLEPVRRVNIREKTVIGEMEIVDTLSALVLGYQYQLACFLSLLMASGMRRSETIQMRVSDFTTNKRIVFGCMYETGMMRTKGRGTQGKMITRYVFKDLFDPYFELWIDERKRLGVDCDALFVRRVNGKWVPVTNSTINSWCSRISRISGVDFYPHAMRHYFTTMLKRQGYPDEVVIMMQKWANPRMIKVYNDLEETEELETFFYKVQAGEVKLKQIPNVVESTTIKIQEEREKLEALKGEDSKKKRKSKKTQKEAKDG